MAGAGFARADRRMKSSQSRQAVDVGARRNRVARQRRDSALPTKHDRRRDVHEQHDRVQGKRSNMFTSGGASVRPDCDVWRIDAERRKRFTAATADDSVATLPPKLTSPAPESRSASRARQLQAAL